MKDYCMHFFCHFPHISCFHLFVLHQSTAMFMHMYIHVFHMYAVTEWIAVQCSAVQLNGLLLKLLTLISTPNLTPIQTTNLTLSIDYFCGIGNTTINNGVCDFLVNNTVFNLIHGPNSGWVETWTLCCTKQSIIKWYSMSA